MAEKEYLSTNQCQDCVFKAAIPATKRAEFCTDCRERNKIDLSSRNRIQQAFQRAQRGEPI